MALFGTTLTIQGQPQPGKLCLRAVETAELFLRAVWQGNCSMRPRRQDLEIAQHDDKTLTIDFFDQSMNPLDVSGFDRITWIVAESVTGAILLTRSTNGGSLVLPTAVRAVAQLTKAQTGALPARRLYHECKGINSGGEQQTLVTGTFTVIDTRISDA